MAKLLPIDQRPPQYVPDPMPELPPMSPEEEAELMNHGTRKGPSPETLAELAHYAESGRLGDDGTENL